MQCGGQWVAANEIFGGLPWASMSGWSARRRRVACSVRVGDLFGVC